MNKIALPASGNILHAENVLTKYQNVSSIIGSANQLSTTRKFTPVIVVVIPGLVKQR